MKNFSDDALAILLLTSNLVADKNETKKTFTLSQWNKLARLIKDSSYKSPSDLFNKSYESLMKDLLLGLIPMIKASIGSYAFHFINEYDPHFVKGFEYGLSSMTGQHHDRCLNRDLPMFYTRNRLGIFRKPYYKQKPE